MKPDVKFIAITRTNGALDIMQFVTRGLLREGVVFERAPTDEEIVAEINKSQIAFISWRRIDPSEIPPDRTFRAAWKDTGRIEIDMEMARAIHRDRLRAMRQPFLAALDVEYQRADEQGDDLAKKRIAARKQVLRDVTKDAAITAAQTPEELMNAIPAILKPEK